MTRNRIEFHAVERIDRKGLAKERRAARAAVLRTRATVLVDDLVETHRDTEDLGLAIDATLAALAERRTAMFGEASTVALLGSLAVQEGAGIKGPARVRPEDFQALVAAAAEEVER